MKKCPPCTGDCNQGKDCPMRNGNPWQLMMLVWMAMIVIALLILLLNM